MYFWFGISKQDKNTSNFILCIVVTPNKIPKQPQDDNIYNKQQAIK